MRGIKPKNHDQIPIGAVLVAAGGVTGGRGYPYPLGGKGWGAWRPGRDGGRHLNIVENRRGLPSIDAARR